MISEKLPILDAVLRENYPGVHETLRPGTETGLRKSNPLRDWFAWQDGQARDHNMRLFGLYRFIPYQESWHEPRAMRSGLLGNPLQAILMLVFVSWRLYCRPLLADDFGSGYFYDPFRRTVFYWDEGSGKRIFPSFDRFIDLLIDAASYSPRNADDALEKMSELTFSYSRQ